MAPKVEAHSPRALRIAFIPWASPANQYVERVKEILARIGSVEKFPNVPALFRDLCRLKASRFDACFVSWEENTIITREGTISIRSVFRLFFKTLVYRAFSRRLIFIRHNVFPHTTSPSHTITARRIVDWYETWFDVVLIHSGDSIRKRRVYCPHPLYCPVPEPVSVREDFAQLPPRYFVAFGRILRYKRLDALVRSFPVNQTLVVAGPVEDQNHFAILRSLPSDNIIFIPEFLSEADAQYLIRRSAGVIISHAEENVIVSGSFFYALSLDQRVFAVETAFLSWVAPRLPPGRLWSAHSVEELCVLIGKDTDASNEPAPPPDWLQREFGDERIMEVVRKLISA